MKTVHITCSFNVPDDLFVSSDTMKEQAYADIEAAIIKTMGAFGALKHTSDTIAMANVDTYCEDIITHKELLWYNYRPYAMNKKRRDEIAAELAMCESGEAIYATDIHEEKIRIRWKKESLLNCQGRDIVHGGGKGNNDTWALYQN